MSTTTIYLLTEPYDGHLANTPVYSLAFPDFGLASEDSRDTGIEHISVTLQKDGGAPGFTVPTRLLREVDMSPTVSTAPATIDIATIDLIGRPLDYAVALAEGYVWARNTCHRSGDGYRQRNEAPQWPVGGLCMIAPTRAKNLHATEPNWDGWILPAGVEPIAPAALRNVPNYSGRWADGGEIIEREHITLWGWGDSASDAWTADVNNVCGVYSGPTPLIAAMRAYVASKLGTTVTIPITIAP